MIKNTEINHKITVRFMNTQYHSIRHDSSHSIRQTEVLVTKNKSMIRTPGDVKNIRERLPFRGLMVHMNLI